MRGQLTSFFYAVLVGTLYAVSLGLSVASTTILDISPWQMLLWCAVFNILFYFLFWSRWTMVLGFAGLVLAGVVIGITYSTGSGPGWAMEANALVERLGLFFARQIAYDPAFDRPVCVFIALILSLYGSMFIRVWFNFYFLLFLGVVLIAVPPLLAFDQDAGPTVLFVLCVLILTARELNWMTVERGVRANSGTALRLLPVCLAVFLLAYLLPKPEGGADPYVLAAGNELLGIGGDSGGDGVPTVSELGGPVSQGNHAVMRVFADEQLYLAGAYYDYYTGSSWEATAGNQITYLPVTGEGETVLSTALYDLARLYAELDAGEASPFCEATIFPAGTTSRVYLPNLTALLSPGGENQFIQNGQGAVTADAALDPASPYTLVYASAPRSAVREAMERGGSYDQDVFAAYLQLPDTVPQRVYELAWSIYADSDSPYAFLANVQAYLAEYPYTLNADELPEDTDFVDFFLFEAGSGYCTSYASAMVVLARACGIPARYAEGYLMPGEQDGDGGYTVIQSNAHAWAEIYVEDIGWVAFEATAAYYAPGDEQEPLDTAEPAPLEEDEPEDPVSTPAQVTAAPTEDVADMEEAGDGVGRWAYIFAAALPVLIAVAVLLLCGRRIRLALGLRRAARLPEREAVLAYFTLILSALRRDGRPINRDETALQYARRLEIPALAEAAERFCTAAYSELEVTGEDRTRMGELTREIIGLTGEKK